MTGRLTIRPWILVLAAWTAYGLSRNVTYRVLALPGGPPRSLTMLTAVLLWAALTPIPVFLARRFPVTRKSWASAVAVHLAGALVTGIVHIVFFEAVILWSQTGGFPIDALVVDILDNLRNIHPRLVKYTAIVALTWMLDAARRAREAEDARTRLEHELAEERFRVARARLYPPVLVESLAELESLIGTDSEAACR
ncbi:MAG: hypothetical protein ABIT01_07295, partial [Thermoanaerobaculia bacterium]